MSESNYSSLLIFFLLTILAEILGTIGGFGSSLFFVSAAQFFYDFKTVLALTGILHIFSNVSKLFFFRKTIEWKLVWWLGISSILFAILGSYLTTLIEFRFAKLVLGLFLVFLSTLLFFRPHIEISPTKGNSVLSGIAAGFLAGFIGTGGAIRGLVLSAFHLEKNLFVGTSAAIDFGVDLSRTLIYLDQNYLDRRWLINIPLMLAAAFLGSFLGKKFLNQIRQETFQKIVLALIFVMGVTLLIEQAL